MADPAYQPTFVWSNDSLVWSNRTLAWDQYVPPPDFLIADALTVMADRGRDLTAMQDRGRDLTVVSGIRRKIS